MAVITADSQPIIEVITEENVSYGLYDTSNGEAAYIIRDEDADQLVARTNGPIEVITLRYELDIAKLN
jgi:hypothetical protein